MQRQEQLIHDQQYLRSLNFDNPLTANVNTNNINAIKINGNMDVNNGGSKGRRESFRRSREWFERSDDEQ
ncbi:hypothetical protein BDCR2A_01503 [Borrelia duttonii CR2A]|uniref:Uncharacterized protein n=1 Tax=Borrelia duttonii CR2A TaxID=1432657 RepID=W6TGR6_9SPIR|nr:hypothetical protein BDCR2A_01503 [Borrelia duttonii CR2A]